MNSEMFFMSGMAFGAALAIKGPDSMLLALVGIILMLLGLK